MPYKSFTRPLPQDTMRSAIVPFHPESNLMTRGDGYMAFKNDFVLVWIFLVEIFSYLTYYAKMYIGTCPRDMGNSLLMRFLLFVLYSK